jgi:Tfp pilus assembly protein FimV
MIRPAVTNPSFATKPRSWRAAGSLATAVAAIMPVVSGCGLAGLESSPGAQQATNAAPTPTPRRTVGIPSPTPAPTFFVYVVRSRDTLSSIARTYRTTALSLSYWNRDRYPNLDPDSSAYDPNTIKAGWRLRLVPSDITDGEDLDTRSPGPSVPPSPTAIAADHLG